MRAERSRKKKLIVAFHFQFANQAAWKCDACRKSGLEKTRRCGWLPLDSAPERLVWARNAVAVTSCPKSYVTPASLSWIEQFQLWKLFGSADINVMPAKVVEAFCILENELRGEIRNAQP